MSLHVACAMLKRDTCIVRLLFKVNANHLVFHHVLGSVLVAVQHPKVLVCRSLGNSQLQIGQVLHGSVLGSEAPQLCAPVKVDRLCRITP